MDSGIEGFGGSPRAQQAWGHRLGSSFRTRVPEFQDTPPPPSQKNTHTHTYRESETSRSDEAIGNLQQDYGSGSQDPKLKSEILHVGFTHARPGVGRTAHNTHMQLGGRLHSRKLTWKPKKGLIKTTVLLKGYCIGFHVSLGECRRQSLCLTFNKLPPAC